MKTLLLIISLFPHLLIASVGESIEGKWTLIECIDNTNKRIINKENYEYLLGTFSISFIKNSDTVLLFCGHSGKNDYVGQFITSEKGDSIVSTKWGSMRSFSMTEFGSFFFKNIDHVNQIQITIDTLTIYSDNGLKKMIFTRVDSIKR